MDFKLKFLEKYSEHVYAVLRIVSGLLFLFHGVQKLFGILGKTQPELFSQMWVGGFIELVAGTLIILGFQIRWAAFLASGTMAVAYLQFHWKFQFDTKFFPAMNYGELAVIYSLLFLLFACRGAGIWSLDNKK